MWEWVTSGPQHKNLPPRGTTVAVTTMCVFTSPMFVVFGTFKPQAEAPSIILQHKHTATALLTNSNNTSSCQWCFRCDKSQVIRASIRLHFHYLRLCSNILAAANRALKAEREKSFSVQDRLVRSYGSSRIAQPLIDRAHRLLESSNRRNPPKRSFKAIGDQFSNPAGLIRESLFPL